MASTYHLLVSILTLTVFLLYKKCDAVTSIKQHYRHHSLNKRGENSVLLQPDNCQMTDQETPAPQMFPYQEVIWVPAAFVSNFHASPCAKEARESIASILASAIKHNQRGPFTVQNKNGISSPDGDPRTYFSWARYYWANVSASPFFVRRFCLSSFPHSLILRICCSSLITL